MNAMLVACTPCVLAVLSTPPSFTLGHGHLRLAFCCQEELGKHFEAELASHESGMHRQSPQHFLATSWQGDALQVSLSPAQHPPESVFNPWFFTVWWNACSVQALHQALHHEIPLEWSPCSTGRMFPEAMC